MRLFYNIAIHLLSFGITVSSLWNKKTALAKNGRRPDYSTHTLNEPIWFHCASLGEFEQARPVIERIKHEFPQQSILLTFFSPSGFEVKKDYQFADLVMYLPYDTPGKAQKFISHFKPKMAVFVKYELWFNFLKQMKLSNRPVYLLSATFRPKHRYFKWYGGFFKRMLNMLDHIFVQDEQSFQLLKANSINHVSLSGDTRYDRVQELSGTHFKDELVEKFVAGSKPVLIAGSSWPQEESILEKTWPSVKNELKLIIAPHDISSTRIEAIQNRFQNSYRYSKGASQLNDHSILIIDNIGLLSKIYRYGNLSFIGGGFSNALHNILEPATYGLPVCFGPDISRFHEASDIIKHGEARTVKDDNDLLKFIRDLMWSDGKKNRTYIQQRTGASDLFISHISQNLR